MGTSKLRLTTNSVLPELIQRVELTSIKLLIIPNDIMNDAVSRLKETSTPPADAAEFNKWIEAEDAIEFLYDNLADDEFIIYAAVPHSYMHAVLVSLGKLDPVDKDDLMEWNFSPSSGWGISHTFGEPEIWISPPLEYTGSKTIDNGEQLVFLRSFEGYVGKRSYTEILQKFVHVFNLHFVDERNAYCRLDARGDLEDFVRIIESEDGLIVVCRRELLEQYATLTDSAIVRLFDFTRWRKSGFSGWSGAAPEFIDHGEMFFKCLVEPDHASYTRGCQIVRSPLTKERVVELQDRFDDKDSKYESFIADDWKNNVISEISTEPGKTANYFTKSDLPFETSPAFFRPEVLTKYKGDSEKYRVTDSSIYCRGAWSLETYDINEAGQVHTYIVYLRSLPYEEQLYWKAYNEKPKGPISKRAFMRDFENRWDNEYDPLNSLKSQIRDLAKQKIEWWTLRSDNLPDKAHYPVTTSADEWANELLNLDQLVVEGFEKGWFRKKAEGLGRKVDPQFGSLKVAEECLIGLGYEEGDAKEVMAPLYELHSLRSKLKGHAAGEEAQVLKKQALKNFGSYKDHFRDLVSRCDTSIMELNDAFK